MTNSLDDFRRCEVDGCIWIVLQPATRCRDHDGPRVPQYAQDDDGGIVGFRFMPTDVRISQEVGWQPATP